VNVTSTRRPVGTVLALGAVIAFFVSTPAARAQGVVFSSFSSTAGLTLNSSATANTGDGTVLSLVDSHRNDRGSAFTTAARNVSGFSTAFQFRISNPGGSADTTGSVGADGLAFVIQRAGNTSLGANGENMGYSGILQSVAIEFDTFKNATQLDPSSNHIGVDTLGSLISLSTVNVTPNFDDGNLWTAWIDYNGTNLEVRVSETNTRPATAILTYSLSLATLSTTLGGTSAYVGFTSATGGAYGDHDIVKWTFSDTYISGGVIAGSAIPEPSAWASLAGACMLGLAAARRRYVARSA
jgi:hypothetical protein